MRRSERIRCKTNDVITSMLDDDCLRYIMKVSDIPSIIMFARSCNRIHSLLEPQKCTEFADKVHNTTFEWKISINRLKEYRLHSYEFESGVWPLPVYDWALLVFPRGNRSDHFSVYLEVPQILRKKQDLCRDVRMIFTLHHADDESQNICKETTHRFYKTRVCDWGFRELCPLNELDAFIQNGHLRLSVQLTIDYSSSFFFESENKTNVKKRHYQRPCY